MAPRSWAGTLVGYETKNQWRIWDGSQIFVKRDVIFDESKFRYKNGTSSEPVGEDTITDLVNLAGILQPVGEGHRIGSIRHNDQIEQRHPNTPESQDNGDYLSDDNGSDSRNEYSPRPLSPENQDIDNSENQEVDDTPDPVNHLLQKNQEAPKAEQPTEAIKVEAGNSKILFQGNPPFTIGLVVKPLLYQFSQLTATARLNLPTITPFQQPHLQPLRFQFS